MIFPARRAFAQDLGCVLAQCRGRPMCDRAASIDQDWSVQERQRPFRRMAALVEASEVLDLLIHEQFAVRAVRR
jgi:hypothetical protein